MQNKSVHILYVQHKFISSPVLGVLFKASLLVLGLFSCTLFAYFSHDILITYTQVFSLSCWASLYNFYNDFTMHF